MAQARTQADVAIVGGGVIGCAVAWRLGQAGLRVVVVERGGVGREASHAAGGMLAPLAEADRADDFFRLATASRALYPGFAAELRGATGVDVEYRAEGTLFLSLSAEDDEELDRRWQWQRAAGLNVKRLGADCARRLEPLLSEGLRWALKFPDDHQVDNRRLMAALSAAARQAGAAFWTETEARALILEGGRAAGLATTRGELRAPRVVVAAGSWSSWLGVVGGRLPAGFEIEPVRGQMVALEMPAPPVSHIIYSRRGYLVPRLGGYLIAGSTSERVGYDKRVTAGGVSSIIASAGEMLPCAADLAITETWAGLRPASPDGLPVLGPDPQIVGLVYATGHYRNGILLAPVTARAISELIVKGESGDDLAPFSVARFARRSAAG